ERYAAQRPHRKGPGVQRGERRLVPRQAAQVWLLRRMERQVRRRGVGNPRTQYEEAAVTPLGAPSFHAWPSTGGCAGVAYQRDRGTTISLSGCARKCGDMICTPASLKRSWMFACSSESTGTRSIGRSMLAKTSYST